ncbi:MAG: nuclear transport factor 2 family protein [Acidimicrobiales bacterium]
MASRRRRTRLRNLVATYTDAINRLAVDEAIRTYADESTFTMMDRPTVVGRDAIEAVLQATVARYELITQLVHSGVVRLDGDRARARWQVTELQVMLDGTRRFVVGRYEDELARFPEGWRFVGRRFVARYLGDLDLSGPVMADGPTSFDLWDQR